MDKQAVKQIRKRYLSSKKGKIIRYSFTSVVLLFALMMFIAHRIDPMNVVKYDQLFRTPGSLFLMLAVYFASNAYFIWRDYQTVDKETIIGAVAIAIISLVSMYFN